MKTKIQTISVIILLVSALVLAGCTSASSDLEVGAEANGTQVEPKAGQASDLEIGAEANGTQVELKAGQALVISLASNPTTGYGWHIAEIDEAILKQVSEAEFVQESSDEQLVGAGGTEVLRFEAVASGMTTLTLTYDRAWEDQPPEQTFTVTIVVP